MKLWRVDDVMTRNVASVREYTPYRDVVDLLIGRRISAVPVVTAGGLRYDVDESMLTGSTLGTPFGVA